MSRRRAIDMIMLRLAARVESVVFRISSTRAVNSTENDKISLDSVAYYVERRP